jgi:hypothetical protein
MADWDVYSQSAIVVNPPMEVNLFQLKNYLFVQASQIERDCNFNGKSNYSEYRIMIVNFY